MAEKMDDLKTTTYIFKVLSGALNGIEFSLSSHTYFMCVGDVAAEQEKLAQNLEFAERTLYLPATGACNNFSVNLTDNVTQDNFEVVVNCLTHKETLTLAFNTICAAGGVHFALKREGEAWSGQVQSGVLPTPVPTEAPATPIVSKSRPMAWLYRLLMAGCLLVLGFGSAAAWMRYQTGPTETSPKVLEELMGKNAGYSVQQGKDRVYYIFAQDSQQADWARQAIVRSNSNESWKVVTPREEEARLARELERLNINFFTIRFDDPRDPTLVMSSTTNDTDEAALKKINKAMLDVLPYARKVDIVLQSDQDVVKTAQEGLLALGFDYQMIQSDRGVTLLIHTAADDGRLAAVSRFTEQFKRSWGNRYVHFSTELREDNLKEKSFKYGQNGYVNMSNSHWLFNNQS